VTVPRILIPVILVAALSLTGCTPEPDWNIGPDGSCDPGQLYNKVIARTDSDPALVVVDVLLINTSGTPCTLSGAPSVTITDAVNTQPIGAPAITTSEPQEVVAMPPGGKAYVLVQTLQSMLDTSTCVGVIANGMHIVLPQRPDATAIVTSSPVAKYCDEPSRQTLRVSPITAEPLVVPGVDDFVPRP
jgi:hypothetical protein